MYLSVLPTLDVGTQGFSNTTVTVFYKTTYRQSCVHKTLTVSQKLETSRSHETETESATEETDPFSSEIHVRSRHVKMSLSPDSSQRHTLSNRGCNGSWSDQYVTGITRHGTEPKFSLPDLSGYEQIRKDKRR